MLGNDAQWVLKGQVADGKAVLQSGRRKFITLKEVPIARRAPISKAYLKRAPGAGSTFR